MPVFCKRLDDRRMELQVNVGEQHYAGTMPPLFKSEYDPRWQDPYPSVRSQLRNHARRHGAPDWVLGVI